MTERPALSIVVCTHNPRGDHLTLTLDSIAAQQGLPGARASEFILIDNGSAAPLAGTVDVSRIPRARIVREDRLGLTHARIKSFHEACGDIILYVDDDNVLAPDYAARVVAAFDADPKLGAVGGKSLPRYEVIPPPWFDELDISLACRDLGDLPLRCAWTEGTARVYPKCAPIGAGMAIRRVAYAFYVAAVNDDAGRTALGRRGDDLSSGEDNDMVMTLLGGGWVVAYLPELSLIHLIPAGRLEPKYLGRYAESSNRTWVQVLNVHGIRPWPPIPSWSLPLRRAKAYFSNRAWRSPAHRIRWRAACGLYAGQSTLEKRRQPT